MQLFCNCCEAVVVELSADEEEVDCRHVVVVFGWRVVYLLRVTSYARDILQWDTSDGIDGRPYPCFCGRVQHIQEDLFA